MIPELRFTPAAAISSLRIWYERFDSVLEPCRHSVAFRIVTFLWLFFGLGVGPLADVSISCLPLIDVRLALETHFDNSPVAGLHVVEFRRSRHA